MEKDLLQEYGMESVSDEDASEEDDENVLSDPEDGNDEDNLNELREQVEAEVKFSEERAGDRDQSKAISFNIQNYMSSLAQHPNDEFDVYEDALEDFHSNIPQMHGTNISNESSKLDETVETISQLHISKESNDNDFDGNVSSNGEDDVLPDLDPKSRGYRLKMVEKLLEDARSHRSYSTSASTIAPSVVKDRIKKTLNVKEKREQRKKCIAKGEASAVTRVRNENQDTCKQYAGWDF